MRNSKSKATLQVLIWANEDSSTNQILFLPINHRDFQDVVPMLETQEKVIIYTKKETMEVSLI